MKRPTTIEWLRGHLNYEAADCLIWPFFRHPEHGRGQMGYGGKMQYAHRVMCELVNGPAPSPDYEAAHSCGNGHLGCVHPKHLSWKTREENQADRYIHNRIPYRKRRFLLTPEQVAEIRALKGRMTQQALADKFGVSRTNIIQIHNGQIWKDGTRRVGGFTVKPYRRGRPAVVAIP